MIPGRTTFFPSPSLEAAMLDLVNGRLGAKVYSITSFKTEYNVNTCKMADDVEKQGLCTYRVR